MKICNIVSMIDAHIDLVLTKIEEALLLLNRKLL